MTKCKSFDKNPKHRALYHALMESILEDEDAMDKGVADKLKKRKPDDADRDEDPPAGPDQGDLTKADLVGAIYNLLKGTYKSYVELEYNMEECYKTLNDQLDWNNPEGDRYPFDLSKPLPLVKSRNHLIVLADYFFNNDLAYLQGGIIDRTYTTSLTKTKAAKWSKHDVYSTKRILAVTNVKVNKWYGYGHLEEIEVQRSNQQLYTFMEGDFPRLHLNDIEDMLLLVIQNRLFNLDGEVIVHLAAALRVIYLDKLERNRLMYSHELYKFSDGTLILVRDKLKDMANNLKMGYNRVMPRRRWSNLDKKRSRIMMKDIDHQLLERRLMRSLEKFIGGREYGEDLRLLQWTI
ncbi:hypothetical protein Tco_0964027 [Tanacetum coccineum]